MLNYAETASSSTIVPVSPVPCTGNERENASRTSPLDLATYVPLHIGRYHFTVSPTFKDGYLAARNAYEEMDEQDECGAYLFLTGYEYAHLVRQYIPVGLSSADKRAWQRGFIGGWTACTYNF